MHRDACQAAQPAVAIPVETQGGQVGNGVSNAAKADTEAGTSEKRRHAHAHTHTHTHAHTHTHTCVSMSFWVRFLVPLNAMCSRK